MKLKRLFSALIAGITVAATLIVPAFGAGAEPEPGRELPTDAYYAYLGVQTNNYVFRDNCADNSKGKYGYGAPEFSQITYWPEPNKAADAGMDISQCDAKLDGNGHYKLVLPATKFQELGAETFNMVFVSTNIPLAATDIKLSNFTLYSGAKVVTTNGVQAPEKDSPDYVFIMLINEYNDDLKGTLMNDVTPDGQDLVIEFDVTGMDHDNETLVEETTEAPTEAATTAAPSSDKDSSDSSNKFPVVPVAIGAAVVVVVIVVIVVAKKKK